MTASGRVGESAPPPPPPPGREAGGTALPAPPPAGESLQRRTAVLIMVVTLAGAVFAFLQASATNRSARADRAAGMWTIEATGELNRAAAYIAVENEIFTLADQDAAMMAALLGGDAGEGGYPTHLAAGFAASRRALLSFTDLGAPDYVSGDGSTDWKMFVEQALVPSYRAAEFEKAHSGEAAAWGAKAGAYVAVITMIAVALFLIGLGRVEAFGSGRSPLVGAGVLLAACGTLWGVFVLAKPVVPPSDEAIDAFVEGRVALNAVGGEDDLRRAEAAFGHALTARPHYFEALLGRAEARFHLDLRRPGGPIGSAGARDDLERAVFLEPLDALAWGDLGAIQFWLGDLRGAEYSTRRALALDPGDLVFSMNLGLLLSLGDDRADYEAQVSKVANLLADAPFWVRQAVMTGFLDVVDLLERFRRDLGTGATDYRERVLRIDHGITVGRRYFGTPTPPAVAAQVSGLRFAVADDGERIDVIFDVSGVSSGQRWLYLTYLGGAENPAMSIEPESWPFAVPDDRITVTLTKPDGFLPGVPVRFEVFVEGSLLEAGEVVPGG